MRRFGAPTDDARRQENFPVASLLVRRSARDLMHAFYAFARAADDVADDPDLTGAQKLAGLDRFEAGLDLARDGAPEGRALAQALGTAGRSDAIAHARRLLTAFRQDATKTRYEDWEELLAYCRSSADPVGRFILDIHDEGPGTHVPADALCTALQILNHLQDLGVDYRRLDRIYLPQDLLSRAGARIDEVGATRAGPALRRAIDAALAETSLLLRVAGDLPRRLRSRRLAGEVRAILFLARRLQARLAGADPLAGRVKPRRLDVAQAGLAGLSGLLLHVPVRAAPGFRP